MLKKPLVIATMTAALATATLSTQASAGDEVLGALIGGGIGAAIGNQVSGHRDARIAGGVLGALIGSSIASESNRYDRGYDDRGYSGYDSGYSGYDSGYYAPSYYAPAPYYPRATIVYRSGPSYDSRNYGRRDWRDGRRNWDGYDRRYR